MIAAPSYILDADVLITAKNQYYAFDICPGFWDSLIYFHGKGHIHSIDRVKNELLAGVKTENLVQWVEREVPSGFFLDADSEAVIKAYTDVMLWAERNPGYFDYAKAKFATGADGWLVAYAMVHKLTVVTNEQPRPEAKREIKLPDVCNQFGVDYKDIFFVLRSLNISYQWTEA